jgi:acetylornithine deacetylase/succinyl-diaminopimelate desuccinylase-like protein
MPFASQDLGGQVTVFYGAKGVVELELISSGEKWGRGPLRDVHSSNKARLDSPAWHLVEALASLVSKDGNEIAIEGYTAKAKSLSASEKRMVESAAKRLDEASAKKQLGVNRWMYDANFEQALAMLVSKPTINIEGLVGGYTGPGGKTILPGRALAKIDMRLVPDMTKDGAVASLKEHLTQHGFGDIEVNVTGGYDPTSTPMDAEICKAEEAVYKQEGIDPVALPRLAGSWPGFVFTGQPLKLPAGHFGLGHGNGAHAPNEYYLIESTTPKLRGLDGATLSYVEYLYQIATQ